MADLIAKSSVKAVVGMGTTGLSVARFLAREGCPFVMLDTRTEPPNLEAFRQEFPDVGIELGPLNMDTLTGVEEVVLSPGVALATPEIAQVRSQGMPVVGDIELFARFVKAPVVAITGSNAKSTVTTLVGEMAKEAGVRVAVGGNIGVPALDLLDDGVELYVLELSSFQLETTSSLGASAATVLNVSADHMDRYDSLPAYHMAKQRVYFGAQKVIVNRDDPLTAPPLADGVKRLSFGLGQPDMNAFGVREQDGEEYLAYQFECLLPVSAMAMRGRHNVANALASLALGQAVGLPMEVMLGVLKTFRGLAHRCEWVCEVNGVDFFNDSKGTNVGATLAALQGLARAPGKLVLIAGGDGKGAEFDSLSRALSEQVRCAVLIGRDAKAIGRVAEKVTSVIYADSMSAAVNEAYKSAKPGDAVLLSPACASFDMFTGFEDRGDCFVAAVKEVTA